MADSYNNDDQIIIDDEMRAPPKKKNVFKTLKWHHDHPGYKVVTMLFLIFYALTMIICYSFIGKRDIGIFHLVPFIFSAIPAMILSEWVWKSIGEPARNVLRWLAFHWLKTLFVAAAILMVISKSRKGIPLENIFRAQGVMQGENWMIPKTEKGLYLKLTYTEAQTYCEKSGPQWHLLASSDIPSLKPTPLGHHKKNFWLSDPIESDKYKNYLMVKESGDKVDLQRAKIDTSDATVNAVICLRKDS